MLDARLLRVGVEVNGVLRLYDGVNITASGTKYANANQNEAEVKLTNMDKATRDYLLSVTSPFNQNRARKTLTIEAGRVSTGYSLVFQGDITNATGGQPPDITITLKAATGDYAKGEVVAVSKPAVTPLRNIAVQVAKDLGLGLDFQANPKNVSNFSFTGAAVKQVEQLGALGHVNAYIDDKTLVVKEFNVPLTGASVDLSFDSGMIGIPEFTETGIKVKMLYDNKVKLGAGLRVKSTLNPAVSGIYTIYQLDFDLANRDTQFYFIASCTRAP